MQLYLLTDESASHKETQDRRWGKNEEKKHRDGKNPSLLFMRINLIARCPDVKVMPAS